jgi:trans-aconitate methyltransferase
LSDLGPDVVGVDVDPVLIAAAEENQPVATWLVGDLAELDLPARGMTEPFDAVVGAGNVMPSLPPSTRSGVLARLATHLRPEGRIAVGFGFGFGVATSSTTSSPMAMRRASCPT